MPAISRFASGLAPVRGAPCRAYPCRVLAGGNIPKGPSGTTKFLRQATSGGKQLAAVTLKQTIRQRLAGRRSDLKSVVDLQTLPGSVVNDQPGGFAKTFRLEWWDALPSRYKVVFGTAMSFVLCNMDKVNMSVAIVPMAQDFGWSPSVSGLVQSSFFWGYMMCQVPGGTWAAKIGGRKVLPSGVAVWSGFTALVPLLASTMPGLCIARAAVGLGEAVAPSAATDIVARTVPSTERARAVSFVFAGLHVGTIVGLLVAPWLITHFGWRSVFVIFGVAGFGWVLWYEQLMTGLTKTDTELMQQLNHTQPAAVASGEDAPHGDHHNTLIDPDMDIPWRAFLRCRPVQALMLTHFCNNWFHYTMLAWLPTYFVDTLSVDLMHAAQTALLPPLASIAATAVAGPSADALIAKGVKVATVRKMAQSIAFVAPTLCLLGASTDLDAGPTVALITAALGLSSFSLAGLYCTHQDMSPKYAPALLGLTNTSGAIPGIVGVAFVGFLLDHTHSWSLALFMPTSFFLLAGFTTYVLGARCDPVDFDAPGTNRPFPVEVALRSVWDKLKST